MYADGRYWQEKGSLLNEDEVTKKGGGVRKSNGVANHSNLEEAGSMPKRLVKKREK